MRELSLSFVLNKFFNILDNEVGAHNKIIQDYFEREVLTEETVRLIPNFESLELKNNSLVKLDEILVIQDCIEDEFYQPTLKGSDGVLVNSGLWTRSIYEPEGHTFSGEMNFTELQVRKRLLARCTKTGKSFVLAMYRVGDENEEDWEKWRQETFKMNSMHQVIGIYEEGDQECTDEDNENIEISIPTVHLIKRNDHVIPNLIKIESESQIKEIKSKFISYLLECFGSNEESRRLIDALILLLVSKPSMRVDGLIDSLFIGKLTLNIILTESDESVGNFKKLLGELKGFSSFVKIDEETFGKEGGIYPRLDVKTGQIIPGALLQQPDGCVLLIDETELKEGQVFKDQAVKNLQSLIDVIRQQRVNYDFGVQEISLKVDMPVVTISRGKKSVLPFDLSVKFPEGTGGIKFSECDRDEFILFKSYLESARNMNFSVTEEMATHLELDYLNLRKSSPLLPNGNPKMNEQEFHRLMNLARLLAVSAGEKDLSRETWEETKSMYLC